MSQQIDKRARKRHAQELRRKQQQLEIRKRTIRKVGYVVGLVIFVDALGYGGSLWILGTKVYPPTDFGGHIEASPPGHILTQPMQLAIQKHMLEHADGSGPPGVVINYNCVDFACEPGLLEQLVEIARGYPAFVYLAPYPRMDAKIALTRLGQLEVLEGFDEGRIQTFIKGR